MDSLKVRGKIVWVGPVEVVGTNGFAKRTFVVCDDPHADYPTCVAFTLKRGKKEDRTTLVTESDVNSTAQVTFFPEARAWDDPKSGKKRWFSDNVAVKVDIERTVDEPNEDNQPVAADTDNLPF